MKTNPTQFSWTPAAANVDESAITAGEVTGFEIGIRPASGSPGVYPVSVVVNDPAATSETLSAAQASGIGLLKDGDYQSAIRSLGPVASAFTDETTDTAFAILAPLPVPKPPQSFTVA